MPGLGDLLYDLFNPQEAGAGMGASPNVRMGLIEGQRMPPDPRMQAYAQQMPPQQPAPPAQAWNDPMSGAPVGAPQAQQPAPAAAASVDPNWADALYRLMAPTMGGASAGGPRY